MKWKNLSPTQKLIVKGLVAIGIVAVIAGIVVVVVKTSKGKGDNKACLPGQDLDECGCGVVYYNSPEDFVIAVTKDEVPDEGYVVNLPACDEETAIAVGPVDEEVA